MRFRAVLPLAIAAVGIVLSAAAAAADDTVALVVPRDSRHRVDGLGELAEVFRRKKRFWGDGVRVDPVNLPADDPLRRRFSQMVLSATPEQLEPYWNDLYFHGILPPRVLKSAEAVIRYVASSPGAIGYIPLCAADDRVMIALEIDAAGTAQEKSRPGGCTR